MPATAASTASPATVATPRKPPTVPEKKYKCQFCNRAFSRSEHRSRHERSRKFFHTLVPLNVGLLVMVGSWCSKLSPTLFLLFFFPRQSKLTFDHMRRYQRATVQMCKVPQYLCATRSPFTTRSHGARERWRDSTAQRSQAPPRRKGIAQGSPVQAIDRVGYSHIGTNRSKQ